MKRLRVGDLVQVTSGKEQGKQGRITKILADEERVVVEGLNTVTRHQRPTPRNQEGGKITKEAPIHASKVMPVDPATGKPTRVKIRVGEDGKKTRVGKSGSAIGVG
ncbi:50S ribosomal protein L24 [Sorangium cellulosum]|jgi:large subunit ribosomal protein L24|uniref:Large ribosomal subunit protein uL24 n=2 Tax=Sorangium cellulosum TaxID=56 RepID=A0A150TYD9_SORCE|nr:50S ribosomal protein L24 [Sorangium cellulosum]AGP41147.1 50S ribosomal protein L24 [Sorangium cellulosum So0157-2]KYF53965.1 50S ribosomal protein L24 [Sorangium cellulosum]KYG09498.1 50S ribosomal protein L24 [Sorangium cellulosum]